MTIQMSNACFMILTEISLHTKQILKLQASLFSKHCIKDVVKSHKHFI